MTIAESTSKYPALMAYIADRNTLPTTSAWCDQLRKDEQTAQNGGLADIAEQLKQAQADYAIEQRSKGYTEYPYNSAMGEYLGLPLKGNNEPEHGYYMASCLKSHYALRVQVKGLEEERHG